jgi:hypothetical protein
MPAGAEFSSGVLGAPDGGHQRPGREIRQQADTHHQRSVETHHATSHLFEHANLEQGDASRCGLTDPGQEQRGYGKQKTTCSLPAPPIRRKHSFRALLNVRNL